MIKGGVSLFVARECRGHAVSPLAASTDADLNLVVSSLLRSHEAKGEPLRVGNLPPRDGLDAQCQQTGRAEPCLLCGISGVLHTAAIGPR